MSEERTGAEPEPEELAEQPEADEESTEDQGLPEDDGEEAASSEAPPRQPSRGDRDFGRLRSDNRELRERLARLEGQLSAPQRPPPDPGLEERQFYESLAVMAPDAQAQAISRRIDAQVGQRLARTELFLGDSLDQQNFRQIQRDQPLAKQLAGEVESTLMAERQAGRNPTRETIYYYLAGRNYVEKAQRAATAQRRQGRERIARETTRPGTARSTANAERQPGQETHQQLYERIKDIPL